MTEEMSLRELRERVRRFASRRLRDPHAAEDVTQDVMLRLHAHAASLPPEPHRRTGWALRVARNLVIDRFRGHKTEPLEPDMPLPAPREIGSSVAALSGCVARMVRNLPGPYRQALELADLQGRPQQAVADEIGISLSGFKSRVQRGRQQLRAMFSQCCRIEREEDGWSMRRTGRSIDFCGAERAGGADETPGGTEKSCVFSSPTPSFP